MEFGSDFHILDYPKGKNLSNYIPYSNLYASGRQALLDLAIYRKWERLWVPSYFCEETLNVFSKERILLKKYPATPFTEPTSILKKITTTNRDGLLIVNYFGLVGERHYNDCVCEIVEDHTHNLISNWALNSSANWCIASLRKTLPIPDGGILWSPKGKILPDQPSLVEEARMVMNRRVEAMTLKAKYLQGEEIRKEEFLNLFSQTEEEFDNLPISSISEKSYEVVSDIDLVKWNHQKKENWEILTHNLADEKEITILRPENKGDTPFSLTLLFKDKERRDEVRRKLIQESVYPAILWKIEADEYKDAVDFGEKILSVHCDGRYSKEDMQQLSLIIKEALN